jgi:hypothetical protein
MDEQAYVLLDEQMEKLRAIASRLHNGSDKMRDEGHKLWLIINQLNDQKVEVLREH